MLPGATGFMSWLFALNVFAPLYITEVAHQPLTTAGFLPGAGGLAQILGHCGSIPGQRTGKKLASR